mgnify:CR=1 FL=1
MDKNRITVKTLAGLLGLGERATSSILYGFAEPKIGQIKTLVNLTGIPFERLFSEKLGGYK